MTKKILSAAAVLLAALTIFCGCNSANTPKGEEATIKSDIDSADIGNNISSAEEQLSKAEAARSTANYDEFRSILTNPDTDTASFNGVGDITIEEEGSIEKTVAIKTTGTVSINSPVSEVVLIRAPKGVTMNAKADSIIIKGEDITCELNEEAGTVYITGKNCVVNVHNGNITKIIARNSTALINNYSDSDIEVTLTNGTKVITEKGKTYDVKNNLIREAE